MLQVSPVTAGELYLNPASNFVVFGERKLLHVSLRPAQFRHSIKSVYSRVDVDMDCVLGVVRARGRTPKPLELFAQIILNYCMRHALISTRLLLHSAHPTGGSERRQWMPSATLCTVQLFASCWVSFHLLFFFSVCCLRCGVSLNTNVAFGAQHVAFLTHLERISPSFRSHIRILIHSSLCHGWWLAWPLKPSNFHSAANSNGCPALAGTAKRIRQLLFMKQMKWNYIFRSVLWAAANWKLSHWKYSLQCLT